MRPSPSSVTFADVACFITSFRAACSAACAASQFADASEQGTSRDDPRHVVQVHEHRAVLREIQHILELGVPAELRLGLDPGQDGRVGSGFFRSP